MVDKTRIGKRIGAGLQHTVFLYGENEVIKIPHWWMRISTTRAQKENELAIAQEYLGEYLPETRIERYKNSYCYIQKRIVGLHPLTLSHLDTHKPDISAFVAQNRKLIAEKRFTADMLGGKAYVHAFSKHAHNKPLLSANILIDETDPPKLYLIDTDLLRTSPLHITMLREIVFAVGSYLFYLLSTFTLKHYEML